MSKVRVLYDFQAEAQNELTTFVGEVLTILDPSAFDGWLKIRNIRGEEGIVPSSYVEYIEDDFIPPPPSHNPVVPSYSNNNNNNSSWDTPAPAYVNQYQSDTSNLDLLNNLTFETKPDLTPSPNTNTSSAFDLSFFESGLSSNNNTTNTTTSSNLFSSNDTFSNIQNLSASIPVFTDTSFTSNSYVPTSTGAFNGGFSSSHPKPSSSANVSRPSVRDDSDFDDSDEDIPVSSVAHRNNANNTSNTLNTSTAAGAGVILTKHKTKNSYGLDVFLLFGAVKNVPDSDKCSTIILNEHRSSLWKRRSPPYLISIVNHHNDKKYHGVKKFITYEIQTEKFPQRVRRRYNQFAWLHERLDEKYPNICVPPLPDKAVTGNFEDEFIMKRKAQLELWLNRLSSHPVISESEVFIHFLQCDDTSSKWKAGKRKAEKDEYRGAQWFCTLTVPGESVDTTAAIKERSEKFSKSTIHLDNSVKQVCNALEKLSSYHTKEYKKEIANLGKRFEDFGNSLSADSLDAPNNPALSRAMVTVGNTYTQISNLYGEQSKEDVSPLFDRFMLYRGIIQQMPDIVQFEKNSIQTYEEFNQRPEKLQGRSLHEIAPRREIISHVTFAEINQFNRDKVDDFTNYMRNFLSKQIEFYTEITDCLKRAQTVFDQIPVTKQSTSFSNSNKSMKR